MTDTTATTLDALVALLKAAEARHADAMKAYDATAALPKGSRGKASALKVAEARRAEAFAGVVDLRNHVTEAKRPGVEAWLAGELARVTDAVLRQILDSADRRRRPIALDLQNYSLGVVYAETTFSDTGLPRHVEIRKLATREQKVDAGERRLERARTEADRDEAIALRDNPGSFALPAPATPTGSVTVCEASTWLTEAKTQTFTLNASSWQAMTDEDARDAVRLVMAGELIRAKLNALAFPSPSVIAKRFDA
jgi:hypothetical protein